MAGNPNKEKARQMYESGMKLIEISKKLGLPEGTIRSWKSRGWGGKPGKGRCAAKGSRNAANEAVKRKKKAENIRSDAEVVNDSELSDEQKLFCMYYVRSFNAVKAYQKAYGCNYRTACSIAYRLLERDGIKRTINELKKNRFQKEFLDETDIFQRYIDIAFADMNDYVKISDNDIELVDGEQTDGTLITEIRYGRGGVSIKLADRMKALEWLTEHMDIMTEEQKAKISLLKAKMQESEEDTDDGFLEALEGKVGETWDE